MKRKSSKSEQGWTTMEFLIVFPLLFATFLMVIHYGLLMKTKLAMSNAAHAAVQAFAKTGNCQTARDYFYANFDQIGGATISCIGGGNNEKSEIDVKYMYPSENLLVITIPAQELLTKSVAMTEKE
jgi:Flp pilus assembly protein TadG